MSNTIDQYRQAKSDYLRLRNQAKKELIARFHQVANELFQIQKELLDDFGEKIAVPNKAKKVRAGAAFKKALAPASAVPQSSATSAKIVSLQSQLGRAKKKVTDLQTAGKPIKAAEDKVYEIEDAMRLAQAK